ncbi:unnamed protein product, partial [marine sediment metagenome]
IIFQKSRTPDIYIDDFIFPLTKNHYLIRANKINRVPNTVKIELDLILFKQAKKYVSCTNSQYPELLNKCFQYNYESLEALKNKVFNELLN